MKLGYLCPPPEYILDTSSSFLEEMGLIFILIVNQDNLVKSLHGSEYMCLCKPLFRCSPMTLLPHYLFDNTHSSMLDLSTISLLILVF